MATLSVRVTCANWAVALARLRAKGCRVFYELGGVQIWGRGFSADGNKEYLTITGHRSEDCLRILNEVGIETFTISN